MEQSRFTKGIVMDDNRGKEDLPVTLQYPDSIPVPGKELEDELRSGAGIIVKDDERPVAELPGTLCQLTQQAIEHLEIH